MLGCGREKGYETKKVFRKNICQNHVMRETQ